MNLPTDIIIYIMKFVNIKTILSLYSITKKIYNNKKIKTYINNEKVKYLISKKKILKELTFDMPDISIYNIKKLEIENCTITNDLIITGNSLEAIYLNNSKIYGKVYLYNCHNLFKLIIDKLEVEDIFIEDTAICDYIQITYCNLNNIPLNISNNNISTLDLRNNNIEIHKPLYLGNNIYNLLLYNNKISEIELHIYRDMEYITLGHNPIKKLNVITNNHFIKGVYTTPKIFKNISTNIEATFY